MVEFVSQLPQYEENLGWKWNENCFKMDEFIEKTIEMLDNAEKIFNQNLMYCQHCGQKSMSNNGYVWNLTSVSHASEPTKIQDKFEESIRVDAKSKCCLESIVDNIKKQKIVIMKISGPISFQISRTEQIFGRTMKYVSHIEDVQGFNQVYFAHGNEIFSYFNCLFGF